MAPINTTNPYMHCSSGAITYEVKETPEGWKVEAKFSRDVEANDRKIMLESLAEYKRDVEARHPTWVVSLFAGNASYSLEITRSKDAREALGALQKKTADFWGHLTG